MENTVKKSNTIPIKCKSSNQRRTQSRIRFKRSLRFALRRMPSSVTQSSPLKMYLFITILRVLQIIQMICHQLSGADPMKFAQKVPSLLCSLMELLQVTSNKVFLVTAGSSVHC
jgi:hypothetical protein